MKCVVIGKLNENTNQRNIVYDKNHLSPTLQAAMGLGGGQIPLILDYKFTGILIGGEQKNQAIKKDGISTTLCSAMGTGGGYIPLIVLKRNEKK